MSSTKRRLSSNSGLLKMCDDENSDEDDLASVGLQEKSIYTFPKKSNARRRSSFGGLNSSKSPVNAAEQARITEMYKTVIQMSSENKLNEKNSWNYDLIDHMGKLIKDESRGVNFQKASCTLDASVKIYSNRVDDTYTSSHRILESLSRNGTSNNPADADEDNDAEEGDNTEGPRKRGTKTSTRLNIATTIERNVSALNAVKLENDVAVDPMFHKISKAFDEGGAKGMLMNNLRTASTGCSLSFHFTDPDPAATAANSTDDTSFPSSLIDISDLLARSGISATELSELCVCPALDMYRDQIGLSSEHLLGSIKEVLTSTAMHAIPSASGDDTHLTAVAKVTSDQRQSLGGEWEDSNNDNDFGYSGHDDGDDFVSSAPPSTRPSLEPFNTRLSGIAGSPNRASLAGSISGGDNHEGHKLRWADETVPGNPSMAADMEVLVQGLESVTISNSGPSEYSYFDTNAIFSSSNAWAGARHWKYATRKRVAKETEITPDENTPDNVPSDTEGATTTAKGAKKASKTTKKTTKKVDNKAGIDFSAELVDVSLFDLPSAKSKSDTTQQTAAAIAKLQSAAASLFLPPDAKVQVKDLCRLYLAPHVMIPANNVQRAVLASSSVRRSGSNKIDRFLAGQSGSERVWGVSGPTNLQTAVRAGASGNVPNGAAGAAGGNEGGYDSGDDGFAYADYDDGDHYEGGASSGAGAGEALPPVLSGLDINTGQLLQADRKVEKIEIGYAKVSKRVNIQRLKIDIWSNLSSQLPVEAEPATPPHRPPQQQLSFQEIITEIAGEDGGARQQDVTLPFYFICLLHLANEHGLRIEDREDMSDLVISMDQK